jgi:hypothetical protein
MKRSQKNDDEPLRGAKRALLRRSPAGERTSTASSVKLVIDERSDF